MYKEKIKKRIDSKFESLEENLKYLFEAQCEIFAQLDNIRYMLFLLEEDN